jgi:hypothetical protein
MTARRSIWRSWCDSARVRHGAPDGCPLTLQTQRTPRLAREGGRLLCSSIFSKRGDNTVLATNVTFPVLFFFSPTTDLRAVRRIAVTHRAGCNDRIDSFVDALSRRHIHHGGTPHGRRNPGDSTGEHPTKKIPSSSLMSSSSIMGNLHSLGLMPRGWALPPPKTVTNHMMGPTTRLNLVPKSP